jgi:ATP synthase I chain
MDALPHDSVAGSEAELFYSGAIRRILRNIAVLGVLSIAPVAWRFGANVTAGFALGAAVSWFNFYSLSRAVQALADRIVEKHSRERGGAVVLRFLGRYLLIGVAAYVIFTRWSGASRGLLAGLCLPVAAMLVEAVYEVYVAVSRGL